MFTTNHQSKTWIPDHMKAFAQCKTNSSGFVWFVLGSLEIFFFFSILGRKYEAKINTCLDQLFSSAEQSDKQKKLFGVS